MDIPEFGTKREDEERRDGGCAVVFNLETQKFAVNRHQEGLLGLFSGGVDSNEDIQQGILREVVEESGLDDFLHVEKIGEALTHYYHILKKVNRVAHATCLLVVLKSTHQVPTHHEEHETFTLDWAAAEEIISNWNSYNENGDHNHWIYFMNKAIERLKELGFIK